MRANRAGCRLSLAPLSLKSPPRPRKRPDRSSPFGEQIELVCLKRGLRSGGSSKEAFALLCGQSYTIFCVSLPQAQAGAHRAHLREEQRRSPYSLPVQNVGRGVAARPYPRATGSYNTNITIPAVRTGGRQTGTLNRKARAQEEKTCLLIESIAFLKT